MKLQGKIIVITGAGKGFGEVLTRALAAEGAKIILSGRNKAQIQRVADAVGGYAIVADVSDESQVAHLATKTVEQFNRIDIWINNAGIQYPHRAVEDFDTQEANEIFKVNFFGTAYGSKYALRQMKKQGNGTILNIISTSGLEGKTGLASYVASKFAVDGFTKTMRLEVKELGITILAVYPGGMQTHLFDKEKPAEYHTYMDPRDVVAKIIVNLKRSEPEEELIIPRPGQNLVPDKTLLTKLQNLGK